MLEQVVQLGQVKPVSIHLCLHQVVADWTGLAVWLPGPRPGPGVLPAPVTPPALHLLPRTPALASQLVTRHALATPTVTVAGAATREGETVMVCHADITPVPRDPRPALTPPRPQVTGLMKGPYGVTVAGVAAGATVDIPVRVSAAVTMLTLHIAPTHALARLCVTLLFSSPGLVALAGCAARAPSDRVPPVTRCAQLASLPGRVVDALETCPRHRVTVPGAPQVDVPVTLTLNTRPGRAAQALRVAVVAVLAELTPGPGPAGGTLGAGNRGPGQVAPAKSGGAAILGQLGARAWLAVIRRGCTSVSIISVSTGVASVPHCVVSAVTHACVHMAVVRVSVAVAGNTFACCLVMVVSWLTEICILCCQKIDEKQPEQTPMQMCKVDFRL